MPFLLLALWLAGSIAIGLPLARASLAKEERLSVLAAYAVLAGHCLQSVAPILLWKWVPLGTAELP